MARNCLNTQIQKFFEETYIKEDLTRLRWHELKKKEKAGQGLGDTKSKQYEVLKKKIKNAPKPDLLDRLPTDVAPQRFNKKISKYTDRLEPIPSDSKGDASVCLTDMRPVSRRTKKLLFDGFTKEGKGRYQYLSARYEDTPEKKYMFPFLSSWEYGWKITEVVKKEDIKKPQYGRTKIVADTFYTRTGIPSIANCNW